MFVKAILGHVRLATTAIYDVPLWIMPRSQPRSAAPRSRRGLNGT
jgi:hypothetical protein